MYYFFDNGAETTSTTGTGTLTLSGAGATLDDSTTGAIVPAAADGLELTFYIENGTAWEKSHGTYTNTGRTLTRTLESSSTGSLLSLTGTSKVHFNLSSLIANLTYKNSRGYIEGLELNYNAGTLKCLEGYAMVNGEILSVSSAGTTTISGDALSGAAIYYIYIYNNSGTVQMHRESRASTADDPVWDTALDYAKHPVDGASKRCIGAVSVGAGSAGVLDEFTMRQKGRERRYYPYKYVARVVSAGSATTATSVDCQASVPAVSICREGGFKLHTKNASIGSTAVVYILWAQTANGATNFGGLQVSSQMDNASAAAALGPMIMPIDSTTFYYLVNNAGTQGFVDVISWGLYV